MATIEAGWEKVHAWCEANPRPTNRRAQKNWSRRHMENRESCMADCLEERRAAEGDFRARRRWLLRRSSPAIWPNSH